MTCVEFTHTFHIDGTVDSFLRQVRMMHRNTILLSHERVQDQESGRSGQRWRSQSLVAQTLFTVDDARVLLSVRILILRRTLVRENMPCIGLVLGATPVCDTSEVLR